MADRRLAHSAAYRVTSGYDSCWKQFFPSGGYAIVFPYRHPPMTDRRSDLGLDPEGLRHKQCPECGMVEVRTVRGPDGAKRYSCWECGRPQGEEAAGSFDPPNYPDA